LTKTKKGKGKRSAAFIGGGTGLGMLVGGVATGGVGLLVNGAVIFIGVNLLGLHYLIAKCVAAGFTFTSNFIARRQILFVRRTAY